MLPAQRNKVDLNSLTEEEKKALRLYGKLPSHKDVLGKKMQERKYFDSGDYALSKAGKTAPAEVGTTIARPENIPHHSNSSVLSGSPPTSSPMGSGPSAGLAYPNDSTTATTTTGATPSTTTTQSTSK